MKVGAENVPQISLHWTILVVVVSRKWKFKLIRNNVKGHFTNTRGIREHFGIYTQIQNRKHHHA